MPSGTPAEQFDLPSRYQFVRLLGAGGMGRVIEAEDQVLGSRVAIKLLHAELVADRPTVDLFIREARITAQLRSIHVPRVHDVGFTVAKQPYMVMELLHGKSLEQIARGEMPITASVDIALEVSMALSEAHALGLVHRDLKLSNIFVTDAAAGPPRTVVLDFGIAALSSERGDDSSVSRMRSGLGTPKYMSPEQVRDQRDIDSRSDIWSLGVVLYRLLSGGFPFRGRSVAEYHQAITQGEVPVLHRVAREVPEGLSDVVMRALDRSLLTRWPTVHEMAVGLVPFGSGRILLPPDDPSLMRSRSITLTLGSGQEVAEAVTRVNMLAYQSRGELSGRTGRDPDAHSDGATRLVGSTLGPSTGPLVPRSAPPPASHRSDPPPVSHRSVPPPPQRSVPPQGPAIRPISQRPTPLEPSAPDSKSHADYNHFVQTSPPLRERTPTHRPDVPAKHFSLAEDDGAETHVSVASLKPGPSIVVGRPVELHSPGISLLPPTASDNPPEEELVVAAPGRSPVKVLVVLLLAAVVGGGAYLLGSRSRAAQLRRDELARASASSALAASAPPMASAAPTATDAAPQSAPTPTAAPIELADTATTAASATPPSSASVRPSSTHADPTSAPSTPAEGSSTKGSASSAMPATTSTAPVKATTDNDGKLWE